MILPNRHRDDNLLESEMTSLTKNSNTIPRQERSLLAQSSQHNLKMVEQETVWKSQVLASGLNTLYSTTSSQQGANLSGSRKRNPG